ncbi:MAG: response regulator [Planctomycetes bacterium]|nr:response regulator [Planctomycetota bacterium]
MAGMENTDKMNKYDMPVILVVDDEIPTLQSVEITFNNSSEYRVLTTNSTVDAISIIEKIHPDIVLLDIHFHDGDNNGIECVQKARSIGYDGIICMFTGDSSPGLLFESALAGADDYIVKGPMYSLSEEIVRILERKSIADHAEFTENIIAEGSFLRSRGLQKEQAKLLADFASLGYPRIKEFSNQTGIPEHRLWKRLSRIRNKLGVDSMTKVTHLLTAISIFGTPFVKNRGDDNLNS